MKVIIDGWGIYKIIIVGTWLLNGRVGAEILALLKGEYNKLIKKVRWHNYRVLGNLELDLMRKQSIEEGITVKMR